MSRKKYPRSKASVISGSKPPYQSASLSDQSSLFGYAKETDSHSERSSTGLPSGVVAVRYSKGKDDLLIEDAISKEIVTLKPGDSRTVHMHKTLVRALSRQGFEILEVV